MKEGKIGIRVLSTNHERYDFENAEVARAWANAFKGKVKKHCRDFVEVENSDLFSISKEQLDRHTEDFKKMELKIQGLTPEDRKIVSKTFPAEVVEDFQERTSSLVS